MNYNDWINWKKSINTERLMVEVYGRKHIEILTDDCRGYWVFCMKGTQKENPRYFFNNWFLNLFYTFFSVYLLLGFGLFHF